MAHRQSVVEAFYLDGNITRLNERILKDDLPYHLVNKVKDDSFLLTHCNDIHMIRLDFLKEKSVLVTLVESGKDTKSKEIKSFDEFKILHQKHFLQYLAYGISKTVFQEWEMN